MCEKCYVIQERYRCGASDTWQWRYAAPSAIDLLQKRLESGQYMQQQPDGEWWLFEADGNGICGGANIGWAANDQVTRRLFASA